MKKKEVVILLIFLITHFGFFTFLLFVLPQFLQSGDVINVYFSNAHKIFIGLVPFKDFSMIYPPLALFSFVWPRFLTLDPSSYAFFFAEEMLIFDLLIGLLIFLISKKVGSNSSKNLFLYSLLIFSCPFFIFSRYDLFATLLTTLSLFFLIFNKNKLSAIFLALGVMTKFYPIFLAPLFFIFHLKNKNNQKAKERAITFSFTLAVLFLIPCLLGLNNFLSTINFQLGRGLHMETLPSSLLLLAEKISLSSPNKIIYMADAWDLKFPHSSAIIILMFFSLLITYFYLIWKYKQESKKDYLTLIKYSLLAILAFIIFNKVFSPQFLIWLFPFFIFIKEKKHLPLLFFLLTCLLTSLIYYFYSFLINKNVYLIVLLVIRNCFLLITFFILLKKPFKNLFLKKSNEKNIDCSANLQ